MLQLRDGRMELTQAQRAAVAVELELLLAGAGGPAAAGPGTLVGGVCKASADASIAARPMRNASMSRPMHCARPRQSSASAPWLCPAWRLPDWRSARHRPADGAVGRVQRTQCRRGRWLHRAGTGSCAAWPMPSARNAMAKDERELVRPRATRRWTTTQARHRGGYGCRVRQGQHQPGSAGARPSHPVQGQADYNAMRNKAAVTPLRGAHRRPAPAGPAGRLCQHGHRARGMFQEGSDAAGP